MAPRQTPSQQMGEGSSIKFHLVGKLWSPVIVCVGSMVKVRAERELIDWWPNSNKLATHVDSIARASINQ